MKRLFQKVVYIRRTRWLILLTLGTLILISAPGGDSSAQDISSNNIFIPIFGSSSGKNNEAQNSLDMLNSEQVSEPHEEDGHDHDGVGHIPEHGRFTTNDGTEQSWPPQVKYIDEVVWDDRVTAAMVELESEVNAAAAATNQATDIRELLGERYVFISAHPIRIKGVEGVQGQRVTYFSYSNNMTIEAVVNNHSVESFETIAASEWQPSLRQKEVDAAIEIARQYWQEQGNRRVEHLEGFTIQTFRTEGGGGYYDTRMTYVSFHMDETSPPELLTWVDLTTETIYRAAIDKGSDNGGVQYVQ